MNAVDEIQKFAAAVTCRPSKVDLLAGKTDAPFLTRMLEEKLNLLACRNELLLPNLATDKTVLILSDYGGEHQGANYRVYSFLVCAFDSLGAFQKAQAELRRAHGLSAPLREFAFKEMHYGPQNRALQGYLRNLNNLVTGALISVVVKNGEWSLWGAERKATRKEMIQCLAEHHFGEWKGEIAEKLVTVLHLVGYLAALFAQEGQNIYWQTDHDSIVDNDKKTEAVGRMLAPIIASYTNVTLGTIGYGKSFGKESPLFLDLLSATDLIAGSLDHYLTKFDNAADFTIKSGADQVLQWHSVQGVALKKYAFIFRPGTGGMIESGTLGFTPKKMPADFSPVAF